MLNRVEHELKFHSIGARISSLVGLGPDSVDKYP